MTSADAVFSGSNFCSSEALDGELALVAGGIAAADIRISFDCTYPDSFSDDVRLDDGDRAERVGTDSKSFGTQPGRTR